MTSSPSRWGRPHDELAATQQDVKDANKAATQAEKDAAAAKQDAADAGTETDKAKAEAKQAKGLVRKDLQSDTAECKDALAGA